jgi:hypothetical protein
MQGAPENIFLIWVGCRLEYGRQNFVTLGEENRRIRCPGFPTPGPGDDMSSAIQPDGKPKPHDSVANPSGNDSIPDLVEARRISRRNFLKTSR